MIKQDDDTPTNSQSVRYSIQNDSTRFLTEKTSVYDCP